MVGVWEHSNDWIYSKSQRMVTVMVTVMVTKTLCTISSSKNNFLGGKDILMDIYTHMHKDVENMVTYTLPSSY